MPAGRIVPLAAALAALLAAGCASVGPGYVRPDTPVPAEWRNAPSDPAAAVPDSLDLAEWWKAFGDEQLTGLVEAAVAGNRDLKQARARIREARARRGVATAGYFPSLDASASASSSRVERDSGAVETGEKYSAGFDAGWEIDLFGGKRRSVEASNADLAATGEELRDVLVSLVAEVALNYTNVRVYQARLAAAETNLRLQGETYDLIRWRREAGLGDELELNQARYNLESTRSRIPSLRTGLEEAMNRAAILLGREPGSLHAELSVSAGIPSAPANAAAGVPADAIRRRPDVRKAERRLAAETARVGVATAELFPKFNLTGFIGLDALTPDGLFSSADKSSGGGALISLPIFHGGSLRKSLEAQKAVREEYLAAYEAAVLGALEEVENALIALAGEGGRVKALGEAVRSCGEAAGLAMQKYEAGLLDFGGVLDAQRSLVTFQDELAESEGALASDLIRLYKALGGGWTPGGAEEPETANEMEKNDEE
ncbi:MAG: efflux transporter outer membrane subunit [Candidatus Krumholzibacteria bacterium]|nr:efflux transporter outer membrane subunit [Candidatus Krumholzibacteria bacterium]